MARLPPGESQLQQPNDQFRQMVFDLTWNNVVAEDHKQNQTIQLSYLKAEDKLLAESKDPQIAEQ